MNGNDLCECGHLRHVHRGDTGCLAFTTLPRKDGRKSQAKGVWHAPTSSICACLGFRWTGLRFVPPIGREEQLQVKQGALEPTYRRISESTE